MNIRFSDGYDKLPEAIKKLTKNTNLFFTREYEINVHERKQRLYYIWSDAFVLVVRVKKQMFLKAAVLESEPYRYKEGEDEKEFITSSMLELKKHGIQWTVCAPTARVKEYPQYAKVVPSGNYIVNLLRSEEEIWANVHSKHRNSIRRGEKANLEIKIGGLNLLNAYIPISIETYARSSQQSSGYEYYKGILSKLDDNVLIFLAFKEGKAQAGGMFYYNNQVAYYLHGASINGSEPGSANYLLWTAMMYFKKMGVREFSFVGYHFNPEPGSKLEGIQRFKERFGGQLENSFNFRYEQNVLAYRLYGRIRQFKSRKPFDKYKDAIDLQVEKYPELNGGEE
ncbi:MAG: peptidoglycan bridge formation glycyltransferase FemA/FemB family protein [Paludibacteraceae bacterium]|nr:peptidoglycan bridge formation glycyltransferase FemA/FemB family protein [Paludibacteraceae bacterium]